MVPKQNVKQFRYQGNCSPLVVNYLFLSGFPHGHPMYHGAFDHASKCRTNFEGTRFHSWTNIFSSFFPGGETHLQHTNPCVATNPRVAQAIRARGGVFSRLGAEVPPGGGGGGEGEELGHAAQRGQRAAAAYLRRGAGAGPRALARRVMDLDQTWLWLSKPFWAPILVGR